MTNHKERPASNGQCPILRTRYDVVSAEMLRHSGLDNQQRGKAMEVTAKGMDDLEDRTRESSSGDPATSSRLPGTRFRGYDDKSAVQSLITTHRSPTRYSFLNHSSFGLYFVSSPFFA